MNNNDIARLRLKNDELRAALRGLMEFNPREYWDGVGDNLHKKTAGAALLLALDKCDAALRDDPRILSGCRLKTEHHKPEAPPIEVLL